MEIGGGDSAPLPLIVESFIPPCPTPYTSIPVSSIHMWQNIQYESKKVPVSVPFRSLLYPVPFHSVFFPVSTVPVRSVPYHSIHFRSNRLPRANSFSARHEFVCKIHCVRWRSIARLFSTTRSRDGFFLP